MVVCAILESNFCFSEGPSPPIEEAGVDLLSLSVLCELEKVHSYFYLVTYLVLLIIVGIIEVWGFLAPRFLGALPIAKAFCQFLGNGSVFGS